MLSIVKPTPVEIKMDLPAAELYSNYKANCTTTSDPVPLVVQVTLDNDHCHYTTSVAEVDLDTKQVILAIEPVTPSCRDVIVKCQANDAVERVRLNITEKSVAEEPYTTHTTTTPFTAEGM